MNQDQIREKSAHLFPQSILKTTRSPSIPGNIVSAKLDADGKPRGFSNEEREQREIDKYQKKCKKELDFIKI